MRTTAAIGLIMLALSLSCEERIERTGMPQAINTVVVEGLLTNERTNHKIKLTIPYGISGQPVLPATGASVSVIEDSGITYPLQEVPPQSGEYYTPLMRAVFGRTYTLRINYKGKEFFAQDRSEPVEPLRAIDYRKVDDSPRFSLSLGASGQQSNYIDHSISWKNTATCTLSSVCEGRIVFYDLKTIDANDIFKPGKAEFTFPLGSVIIRRKYGISAAYKNFLRSVLSETEWRGGVFDVERANTTSNVSEGALGFFAVTSVVSDTTVVVNKP